MIVARPILTEYQLERYKKEMQFTEQSESINVGMPNLTLSSSFRCYGVIVCNSSTLNWKHDYTITHPISKRGKSWNPLTEITHDAYNDDTGLQTVGFCL